jgi:ribosomal protein S18 acetylase RimI-like enzyme
VTDLEIRPCRRGDLRALEWGDVFRGERTRFARVFAVAEHGGMAMLVAERAGHHAGQIWIDLARDRARAVLWALRVKPEHRGRGIGTALVAAGERVARGADRTCVELEVEPHNARARALYERLGYVWVRRQLAIDALTGVRLALELDVLRRTIAG